MEPEDPDYERGFELRCDGRYDEAKQVFKDLLARKPGHVKAQMQLGLIEGFLGDFDGSLVILQNLSNANPNNTDVRYELAMTQMMLGMYDEGCANLREVLRINPTHEKAIQQSAYC